MKQKVLIITILLLQNQAKTFNGFSSLNTQPNQGIKFDHRGLPPGFCKL